VDEPLRRNFCLTWLAGWGDIMLLFTGSKLGGKLSADPRLVQVGSSHMQVHQKVGSGR